MAGRISPQARGYVTPSEEDQARALLFSIWQSRSALLELIASCRGRIDQTPADQPGVFLVAFAAVLVLVDAARFLRATLGDHRVVKRKLNEPAPQFDIPGGTYDTVQRSLLSARHAWHLYHAIRFFDENEQTLRTVAQDDPLDTVMDVIGRRRHCLDVSLGRFAQTKLRVRTSQMFRGVAREVLGRALYGLQKLGMGMMADIYVRPGHTLQTLAKIFEALTEILMPGDDLIVRKEYALTNYFLPGHWPHAAL